MLCLTFSQKCKNVPGKENPGNILLEKQKIEKSATMSGKHIFKCFAKEKLFVFSDCIIFILLYSAAPSKMSTFGKVYFHHSEPLEKVTFLKVLIFEIS